MALTFQESLKQKTWIDIPTPWRWSPVDLWLTSEEVGISRLPNKRLENLWIDTAWIDNKIEEEIRVESQKTLTEDEFFNRLDQLAALPQSEWLSDDEIYNFGLQLAKDKWYRIEWIDIDTELWTVTEFKAEEVETTPKKPTTWLWFIAQKSREQVPWILGKAKWLWQRIEDVVWGAISQAPQIVWNTAWFLSDVIWFVPEKLWVDFLDQIAEAKGVPTLSESFKQKWIDTKEKFQEFFDIDPESGATKIWEIGAEIWTAFSWPSAVNLSNKVVQWFPKLRTLAEKSPKLFNTIKSALSGAWEAAKFEVISEWEISPTSLAIWAVANPLLDKTAKVIWWPTWKAVTEKINERFGKLAQKLAASSWTKKLADKEIKKWTQWAFLIRQNNPGIKIDEVWQVLELSKKTRDKLWTELTKARWVWNIDSTPVIKWIDDVTEVLQNPSWQKAKSFALDRWFTREVDQLAALPNRKSVIKQLQKSKEDIVSRWLQSVKQADDQIVWINKNLANFFSGKSEKLSSQVESAVASKLRWNLDDTIGKLWNEFRRIKQAYGNVRTFENNLNSVYIKQLKSKDATLWDFADTFILGNIWASLAAWNLAWLAKWLLQKGIKEKIKLQNDPNFVLRQMFKLIDKRTKEQAWKWAFKEALRPVVGWAIASKAGEKADTAVQELQQ